MVLILYLFFYHLPDFPRRHSTGRDSSVSSLPDSNKENSKDRNLKPTRVRSPAHSKGTKNFMSPTISAASKINASPRKKILVERNELRSSVSFSDVKSLIMEDNEPTPETTLKQKKVSFSDVKSVTVKDEPTPEICLKQKKVSFSDVKSIIMENEEPTPEISLKQKVSFADVRSEVTEDNESTPKIGLNIEVPVPHNSPISNHEDDEPLKSNADFDSMGLLETITDEKDSVNVDPSFKISPRVAISPSCPVLAPLDADPLMIPYDPKTNYLSPRPQFLRYRPNPRIELYREREGKQLEEHFASESFSDSDVSEETQSEGSDRESGDISSEEAMEDEEELLVSETNSISPDMVEEKFEAKRISTPRFSTRSKFMALLLVLALAYFSVLAANSPAFTGLEELSLSNFQVPPEVNEFMKANFDRFTRNLQHWSDRFVSYVSNIISRSREVHKMGPLQYANLSRLLEDHHMIDHVVMESVRERDVVTEPFDKKYHPEIRADEVVDAEQEDHENEDYGNLELVSEEAYGNLELQEGIEAEMTEHGVEFTAEVVDSTHRIIPQVTEIQHDISKTGEPEANDLNNKIAETVFPKEEEKSDDHKIEDSTDNSQSSEVVVDYTTNGPVDQFLRNNVMSFSLLLLCLLAASATFIYTKRSSSKPSMFNAAAVPVEPPVLDKKAEYSPVSVEKEVSESCPSEMSSCPRTNSSSSYSKNGLKESNEYQSQERKPRKTMTYRRESLASSDFSMGSPSYGSFTTYEKMHSKHVSNIFTSFFAH